MEMHKRLLRNNLTLGKRGEDEDQGFSVVAAALAEQDPREVILKEISPSIAHQQSMEDMVKLRQLTQERPNWNLSVGDKDFETDFFLRFRSPYLEEILSTLQIRGNTYSYTGLALLFLILSLQLRPE